MRGALAHTYINILKPIPTHTHTPWKGLWGKTRMAWKNHKNRDVMDIAFSVSQNAIHEY